MIADFTERNKEKPGEWDDVIQNCKEVLAINRRLVARCQGTFANK